MILMFSNSQKQKGFTLIELLVVIAILGLLASVILVKAHDARERARVAIAMTNQRQLQKAIEMYYNDIGFYPPDVNRGWDPGISQRLPYNKDLGNDCEINPADCPACSSCPADWINQVKARWKGPYTASWPNTAPWGGKYDYNNWTATTTRYGCSVPPGIYIGTQRNYDDTNPIPPQQEQWFLDQDMDADNCLNGEAQLMLIRY
jgi:prepilin-type N-terminal cleavage/methylation domain-containing protein